MWPAGLSASHCPVPARAWPLSHSLQMATLSPRLPGLRDALPRSPALNSDGDP